MRLKSYLSIWMLFLVACNDQGTNELAHEQSPPDSFTSNHGLSVHEAEDAGMSKRYFGSIALEHALTEQGWSRLVADKRFSMRPATKVNMINPATGDTLLITDPPNLLAEVVGSSGSTVGSIRTSRLALDGIDFQGEGDEFQKIVGLFLEEVGGEMVLY